MRAGGAGPSDFPLSSPSYGSTSETKPGIKKILQDLAQATKQGKWFKIDKGMITSVEKTRSYWCNFISTKEKQEYAKLAHHFKSFVEEATLEIMGTDVGSEREEMLANLKTIVEAIKKITVFKKISKTTMHESVRPDLVVEKGILTFENKRCHENLLSLTLKIWEKPDLEYEKKLVELYEDEVRLKALNGDKFLDGQEERFVLLELLRLKRILTPDDSWNIKEIVQTTSSRQVLKAAWEDRNRVLNMMINEICAYGNIKNAYERAIEQFS